MDYIKSVDKRIKSYFKIIENEYPEWLDEYINTEALLKQQYIGVACGKLYSNLFKNNFFYSNLDHSIAVALIIWHFTHDKKQTLSGLFHDISTPVFKHSIDFLNGDYMTQESTEDLTKTTISDSKEIMTLLKRDKIKVSEVNNYHLYPIADNDTPKLSADRLEYSLSNALFTYNLTDEETVKKIYNDLEITKNEDNIDEISFKTKKQAREFVKIACKLSIIYRDDKTRYSMQFLADIIKKLKEDGVLTKSDLYKFKEKEIIAIIEKSKYSEFYNIWKNAKRIKTSKEEPQNVYYVHHGAKIRYVDPLVNGKRISEICKISKRMINNILNYDMDKYVYLNFNL